MLPVDCKRCEGTPFWANVGGPSSPQVNWCGLSETGGHPGNTSHLPLRLWKCTGSYSAWQFHVYTLAALECMIQFSGGERFHIFGVFGQSSLSELKKLHYLQTLFPNLQKGIKFFLIFNTIFKNHFSLERSLCVFMFGCVRARLLCLGSCVIFSCSMGSLNYNTWDLVPQPRIGPGPPALGAGES